ncbi:excalibur calcium-binding domain-containing protein [Pseudorhizobium tarimense]|uniref:excalibur calcium-binding domain-containing protein n=2 Tax=Pseudorhizobium tarimense TaxID=1079109 RepID=UPI00289F9E3B|nr:excalibur calcium-binding domain-containing protein [Pseudorhizobium tarimense]
MPTLLVALLAAAPSVAIDGPMTPWRGSETAQSWSCQPRKTCGRIQSCEEAEWYLANCSWGGRLDGDSDGIPCEKLC